MLASAAGQRASSTSRLGIRARVLRYMLSLACNDRSRSRHQELGLRQPVTVHDRHEICQYTERSTMHKQQPNHAPHAGVACSLQLQIGNSPSALLLTGEEAGRRFVARTRAAHHVATAQHRTSRSALRTRDLSSAILSMCMRQTFMQAEPPEPAAPTICDSGGGVETSQNLDRTGRMQTPGHQVPMMVYEHRLHRPGLWTAAHRTCREHRQ